MARFFEAMSAAVKRHGGTVEKFIGDAVMTVLADSRETCQGAPQPRLVVERSGWEIEAC
jgi:class 3 adenylate cyclase